MGTFSFGKTRSQSLTVYVYSNAVLVQDKLFHSAPFFASYKILRIGHPGDDTQYLHFSSGHLLPSYILLLMLASKWTDDLILPEI